MGKVFFIKTAWQNVKRHYRFYVPQILTGTGLLACFYIVLTLSMDKRIHDIKGGDYMPLFMGVGTAVISILSIILILYTNSFLMRQRKGEYGLYHVLGMEKRHVARILVDETLISGCATVVMGLLLGMLFYKLSALLICRILQAEIVFGLDFLRLSSLIPSALFFLGLYLLSFLVNLVSLYRLKPVDLMQTKSRGEKEPKIKWPLFIIGLITLISGYTISVCIKSPLMALLLFFAAVFLVIIGTYFLFTAGSIFILKCLKKNRAYYYQKDHMASVSGLLYRMKQNAVGLASICILATGVLVMVSSTVSLYSGMQDTLNQRYPNDLYFQLKTSINEEGDEQTVGQATMEELVKKAAAKANLQIESMHSEGFLQVGYLCHNGQLLTTKDTDNRDESLIATVIYITAAQYEKLTGEKVTLSKGEIAVAQVITTPGRTETLQGDIWIHGKTWHVKEALSYFPIMMDSVATSGYGIVVPDEETINLMFEAQKDAYGQNASTYSMRLVTKFQSREEAVLKGDAFDSALVEEILAFVENQQPQYGYGYSIDSYWAAAESITGMYGALLFLGIILGLVCMFATVLIIYYKQISEGYEDRDRFQIMKKVGMSDEEVKKTIGTQTKLVFFLPLVFAGLHMAFAFPMLNRLLHIIMLSSTSLFLICTLISFAVFALVYFFIYWMTAKTYYKIVN